MVGVTLLIGLAAINTGAPLLYLLFSMMCAFLVLSALLAANTLKGLWVSRELPRVWPAREPLQVSIRLNNRKYFLSSFSIRVRDFLADGDSLGAAFFEKTPSKTTKTENYECEFFRRGPYKFGRLEMATRFPFGLIERRVSIREDQEILILPPVIDLGEAFRKAISDFGDHSMPQKGHGIGLYGLRDYDHSLPARDIHWRVSARMGKLISRENESEERRRSCVILDNRVPTEQQDDVIQEEFEKAVILANSVISWLISEGYEVELRLSEGSIAGGSGKSHFMRCQRALALTGLRDSQEAGVSAPTRPGPDVVTFPIAWMEDYPAADGVMVMKPKVFEAPLMRALGKKPASDSREVLKKVIKGEEAKLAI